MAAATNFILVLTTFLLTYNNVSSLQDNDDNTVIELAFVIFRHPERVPETNEQYPNDEYKIQFFEPLTYGQLPKEGMQRQYQLGKALRKRYNDFLGDVFTWNSVATFSTDWDRTKMSALLTLAGLFPPRPSQQWDSELHWLPIAYRALPSTYDHLIQRPDAYCPRYVEELHKVFKSKKAEEVMNKYDKLLKYISASSGRNITNLHDAFRIYQNIHSKKVMNLTVPEWALSIYPEPLHTVASFQCVFENYNNLLIRLNGGHMLQKFLEIAQQKIAGTLVPKDRKMYLYSGHENNIVNMLAVLGVYDQHLPPYSCAFMLELHRKESTNEYGFKIFYHNTTDFNEIQHLVMPGCEPFCKMETFLKITEPLVPVNYTEECESKIDLDTY